MKNLFTGHEIERIFIISIAFFYELEKSAY